MKTAEIQKWAADHGGWGEIVPTRVTKKVKTPLHPEGEDTAVTVYVLRTLNGSELKLQPQEGSNGDDPDNVEYDVIEDPKITTSPSASGRESASTDAESRNLANERQREREWNQANGGLYETHKERADREAAAAARTQTAQTAANQRQEIGRKTVDDPNTGKKVTVITYRKGDGTTEEVRQEEQGPIAKPTLVDLPGGGKGQLVPDPANPGTFKVVPVEGTAPSRLPAGIGEFQPDDTMPGYGLYERRAALLDLVAKGTITEAQMKEILTQDRELTNTWATQRTQIDNGANTAYDNLMTQRSADITQAANRMTAANTQYSNALSYTNQNAVGLARSPGIKDSIGPLLRGQMLHSQRMGGMESAPSVPLPKALEKYLTIDLPGTGKIEIPVGITDKGPGAKNPPDWNTVPYQQTEQPAPEQTPAAMQNTDPNQAAYDLFGDDPEFQSQVGRVLGMGVA